MTGEHGTIDWATFYGSLKADPLASSLVDVTIVDTSDVSAWQGMLDWLHASGYEMRFMDGDTPTAIPRDAAKVLESVAEMGVLLEIDPDGIDLHGHFWGGDIEFDGATNSLNSQERLDKLVSFMAGLGRFLGKYVILTGDNCGSIVVEQNAIHETVLHYSPETDIVLFNLVQHPA